MSADLASMFVGFLWAYVLIMMLGGVDFNCVSVWCLYRCMDGYVHDCKYV